MHKTESFAPTSWSFRLLRHQTKQLTSSLSHRVIGHFTQGLFTFTFCLVCSVSHADIHTERTQYQQALTALANKDVQRADKLIQALHHYPLVPYLQAKLLEQDPSQHHAHMLEDFIHRYADAPFSDRVQATRLNSLYKQQQWQAYSHAWQQKPLSSAKYRCQKAYADLQQGQRTAAFQQAAKLWNIGSSQHTACDPLFQSWMQAGYPKATLVKSRFWKAARAGNLRLARYIQKKMVRPKDRQDAALFFAASKDPATILTHKKLVSGNAQHGLIADYAVRKLARKDIYQAVALWLQYRDQWALTPKAAANLNRYFAMRFAKGYRQGAAQTLARLDPHFTDDKISAWKVRLSLAKQDWHQALTLIKQMPNALRNTSRWRYWTESLQQRIQPKYQPDFTRVRQSRNFYGFLTSEITGAPYRLHYQPADITQQEKHLFAQRIIMRRIHELLVNKQFYDARREWNAMVTTISKREIQIASHVVYDWGWYDQAIRGASKIKAWNDLDIRFPTAHQSLFKKWSQKRNIETTWPISIARQESAYDRFAQSHVGARGLMQLMPATAKATANKHQVPYQHRDELYEPNINIALGTAYLAEMLKRFEGNRIYATAAYNAGPHRVKQWLAARGTLPLDVWIETIPFDETRNYVQNVLSFGVIYDLRQQRKPRLLNAKEQALLAISRSSRQGVEL